MTSKALSSRILDYWFQGIEAHQSVPANVMKQWFNGGKEVDDYIITHFKMDVDAIMKGKHDTLGTSSTGLLSLIIALDQFPRNMYRNTPNMFHYDTTALKWAKLAIEQNMDITLSPVQRGFLYLPFEHSENLQDQENSVQLFTSMLETIPTTDPIFELVQGWLQYSKDHHEIIATFGRFPHRNIILGRSSTDLEQTYLESRGTNMYGIRIN